MKTKLLVISGFLSVALLLPSPIPSYAEVAGQAHGDTFSLLYTGIIEDPDPVPLFGWDLVHDVFLGDILNPDGEERGDGPIDASFHPTTGAPIATWAYQTGSDHDIVINEWSGDGWGDNVFVTSGTDDEVDPRVHIDDQERAYLVWWVDDEVQALYLCVREAGSQIWGLPQMITAPGRRPSVIRHNDNVLIAFERDFGVGGQEVVLAVVADGGGVSFDTVALTARTERLDVMLHKSGDVVWMDWMHADATMAYSVLTGETWAEEVTVPWRMDTWVAKEEARKIVRSNVLLP
jgi:hypothetical protein